MHHALGLTRGAAGVDKLRDRIWRHAVLRQNLRSIRLLLPGRLLQQGFKTVRARTANAQHMLQMRQLRLYAFEHGLVIDIAKVFEHDHHFGFAMAQHEVQLTFAEDRHQRVQHRANASAGQIQHAELPHIGQLASHHIRRPHAQAPQANSYAVCHAPQFGIVEAPGRRITAALCHQRQLVRRAAHCFVQCLVDGGVLPPSLLDHVGAARRQQYGIKLHVLSPG